MKRKFRMGLNLRLIGVDVLEVDDVEMTIAVTVGPEFVSSEFVGPYTLD
jgi:hypothetical protein